MESGEARRLAEEQAVKEIHESIENNWILGEEEQLIFGWFSRFRDSERKQELEEHERPKV